MVKITHKAAYEKAAAELDANARNRQNFQITINTSSYEKIRC